MKDPHFLSWEPMFHWTDSKIRIHAFYCVLALILGSLLQWNMGSQLRKWGSFISANALSTCGSVAARIAGDVRLYQVSLLRLTRTDQRLCLLATALLLIYRPSP